MHNAPPVVFPVGRFVWGHAVMVLLAVCGALGLWVGAAQAKTSQFLGPWLGWCGLLIAALLVNRKDHWTNGSVVWTGEVWLWRDPLGQETQTRMQVVLDFGTALAVSLRPVSARWYEPQRFIWLTRKDQPARWHALRCAVYSRPRREQKPNAAADDGV